MPFSPPSSPKGPAHRRRWFPPFPEVVLHREPVDVIGHFPLESSPYEHSSKSANALEPKRSYARPSHPFQLEHRTPYLSCAFPSLVSLHADSPRARQAIGYSIADSVAVNWLRRGRLLSQDSCTTISTVRAARGRQGLTKGSCSALTATYSTFPRRAAAPQR